MKGSRRCGCWCRVRVPSLDLLGGGLDGFDRDVWNNALALDTGALMESLLLNRVNMDVSIVLHSVSGNASVA